MANYYNTGTGKGPGMGTNNFKTYFKIGLVAVGAIILLALASSLVSTVDKGTYQIKQAAITGTMSAHMQPGVFLRFFGDTQTWPMAETFYFTKDKEGGTGDASIPVRFNDGSMCDISGTVRISMPASESQALDLVVKLGFRSHADLENKLILPVIRNALNLTANLMTARESYAERRSDFIYWAWDQIQNGLYETTEETRKVPDPITGEMVTKTFKVIHKDETGRPKYQKNPLGSLGVTLSNFEVKAFEYSDKVKAQIESQQTAYMAVATAKAEAQKAEQDKLKIEAEGKAKVATAQYEKEQDKVREVVEAQKRLEVAKLDKQTAELKKAKDILEGQGEAEKRKLIMTADGALTQKLSAWIEINKTYAVEFGKQKWVPETMIANGTGGATGSRASDMIDLLTVKTAKQLGLNADVKAKGE